MSNEELWSIYGELANKPVQTVRVVCRSRLTSNEAFLTSAALRRTARQCESIAEKIQMLGGSENAIDRANKYANIHRHFSDKPQKLHSIVKKKYRNMFKNVEENVSVTDFNDERLMCPYEESGSKKSCWTCHLPSQVWEAMERNYEQDKFGDKRE
jgi:plasmid maintenance system killer protein